MANLCTVCGTPTDRVGRVVLVTAGRVSWVHCSEPCLRERMQQQAQARRRDRRWFALAVVVALLPATASILWQRYHLPRAVVIVAEPPPPLPGATGPEPVVLGPAWPPTDADWTFAFDRSNWIYPLPGPNRRPAAIGARIFGPEPPAHRPARCREDFRCGVDLGGDLWGEHVYAAHDGVVEHVQTSGNDERGGEYVRLSHFGGMVFTQYFHLAATPRWIARGTHVKAGDVIGLLGDTGLPGGARRHLRFTISIRPTPSFAEVYWDPQPLMAEWPLRVPSHGSVAGYALAQKDRETSHHRRTK